MSDTNSHTRFMTEALSLAARAHPAPNPRVGALVVHEGAVLGRGFHEKPGTAHAEVHALNEAGGRTAGADLYVTLEPCCHEGGGKRTPPCTRRIISSGIRRVIAASEDPNPLVRGAGFRTLREAGIEVVQGVMAGEERLLNREYHHFQNTGLPWVHLKQAASLDGFVSRLGNPGGKISSAESLEYMHTLRRSSQAILAGAGTVMSDNPLLTARPAGPGPLLRIILDGREPLDTSCRVFQKDGAQTLLVTAHDREPRNHRLRDLGVEVLLHDTRAPRGLESLMRQLASESQIIQIFAEAGPVLSSALMRAGLVNEYSLNLVPELLGGGVHRFSGKGKAPEAGSSWVLSGSVPTGRDLYLNYLREDGAVCSQV